MPEDVAFSVFLFWLLAASVTSFLVGRVYQTHVRARSDLRDVKAATKTLRRLVWWVLPLSAAGRALWLVLVLTGAAVWARVTG